MDFLNTLYYYMGYEPEIEANEKQKYNKYLLCEQIKKTNIKKLLTHKKMTNDLIISKNKRKKKNKYIL